MLRRALALLILGALGSTGLGACGRDVDPELMAGQVARMNRDLALLTERVSALEQQAGAPAASGQGLGQGLAPAPTDVPRVPEAPLPDALTVHIDDAVRVDGAVLAGDALAARLADHAGKGPGARLEIRIAASTPQTQLAQVLDLARQSGIREVAIVTQMP
jgi:biopolymer transport protein ExbD